MIMLVEATAGVTGFESINNKARIIMKEAINPEALYSSLELGFSHAVKSNGKQHIHCSGQIAWDKNFTVVGAGDVGAQAHQALANLTVALEAAGATVGDVVRLRTYVVNYSPALLEPIGQAIRAFYGDNIPAANTLIGVQSLALPEFLIEVEATAEIG